MSFLTVEKLKSNLTYLFHEIKCRNIIKSTVKHVARTLLYGMPWFLKSQVLARFYYYDTYISELKSSMKKIWRYEALRRNFLSKIKNFFTRSHFRSDLLKNNYEDLSKNEILQRNSFGFFIIYFLSKIFKRSFKEFLWITFEEWDLMKIFTKVLRIIFIFLKIFERKLWRRVSYFHIFLLEDFASE